MRFIKTMTLAALLLSACAPTTDPGPLVGRWKSTTPDVPDMVISAGQIARGPEVSPATFEVLPTHDGRAIVKVHHLSGQRAGTAEEFMVMRPVGLAINGPLHYRLTP